jgi:hypothetical protein
VLFCTFRYRTAAHLRLMEAAAAQLDVRPAESISESPMPDLLAFVFVPAAATMLGLLAAPVVYVRHLLWRRTARRLNTGARCGLCRGPLGIDTMFLYGGAYVCRGCADRTARRLRIVLPLAVGGAALLAVTSVSAMVLSIATGGPGLAWWLSGPWWLGGTLLPVALPAVALATATLVAIRGGRQLNQLRNAADAAALPLPASAEASLPEA